MTGPNPSNYDSKAAKRLVGHDNAGQDHAELAAVADGDKSRVDSRWFTAQTFLEPIEDSSGLVWLKSTYNGPGNRANEYYGFIDGEFVFCFEHSDELTDGAEAIASFSIDYANDDVELVPVWVDETPLGDNRE